MLDPETISALVARAQRGEAAAFATLARAFLRAAYAVALAVVGHPSDAEDVAQDAFVVALERIGTCRERERFGGWLLQIVRHRALNWLDARRLRDAPSIEPALEQQAASTQAPAEIGLRERLIDALGQLPPTQCEVVLLHDMDDWTHAEIGAVLGISEVMSRQHLFVARRTLRNQLADYSQPEVEHV